MKLPIIILLLIQSSLGGLTNQDQKQQSVINIENLMSAAECSSAGLSKLSAQELRSLNSWLQQYSRSLVASVNVNTTPSVVESRINGTFEGWTGDTVFTLLNGQIWKQAMYSYTYHYAYSPEVLIYRSGNSFKMRVEGVTGFIYVTRLR